MDEQERQGEDTGQSKLNPWLAIFVQPRATTRRLLEEETASSAQTLWLSFTAFLMVILFVIVTFFPAAFGTDLTKMQLVAFTPVVFLLSWVYFLASSYLFWYFSRAAGGQAELWHMKVVNSFTTVIPSVVFGFVRIVIFFGLGKDSEVGKLAENAIIIWSIYITLAAVAEATRLPVWRSMIVYIFTAGVMLAAGALLAPLWARIAG